MSVVLRWRAKSWEKEAKLYCRLFGHVWRSGWWGDKPYLLKTEGPIDNIGRTHFYLDCRCDKCDTKSTVAMIHEEKINGV